jgi:hypothetical protein
MGPIDVDMRFDYHPPVAPGVRELHEAARADAKKLATLWAATLPEGREKSLAFTHLEEALMWANAAIARGNA